MTHPLAQGAARILAASSVVVLAIIGSAAVAPAGAATPPMCTVADMSVAVRVVPGSAGMMHETYRVSVANTSRHACSLRGYAGVSLVTGRTGSVIGAPATWEPATVRTLSLAPGRTASADVRYTRTDPYDPATCRPRAAAGWRVYLPGATQAVFVPGAPDACTNANVHLLAERPFVS
ncbi:MAG: DUF4232 domain-containing protein [Dermatophilaceae bacterium]